MSEPVCGEDSGYGLNCTLKPLHPGHHYTFHTWAQREPYKPCHEDFEEGCPLCEYRQAIYRIWNKEIIAQLSGRGLFSKKLPTL